MMTKGNPFFMQRQANDAVEIVASCFQFFVLRDNPKSGRDVTVFNHAVFVSHQRQHLSVTVLETQPAIGGLPNQSANIVTIGRLAKIGFTYAGREKKRLKKKLNSMTVEKLNRFTCVAQALCLVTCS